MASDDIRATINKYLPESVRLREQRTASRPKVRTPQGDNPLSLLPKARLSRPQWKVEQRKRLRSARS